MSASGAKTDYEIMIVGGGPAGISTWLHLHKFAPELASKTLLIEKEKYPREKLCGGGVGGWCGYILKNLNVALDIPSITVSDVEFVYENEKFVLHQPNSFQMVQRVEFDHALAKNAINRGLNLHQNELFLDLNERDNELTVKTTLEKYKIKTLVGADGALSAVRKKMNLKNKSNLAPTLEIFSPVNPKYDHEYDEKKILIDMNPMKIGMQGYVWHVPVIKECPWNMECQLVNKLELGSHVCYFGEVVASHCDKKYFRDNSIYPDKLETFAYVAGNYIELKEGILASHGFSMK